MSENTNDISEIDIKYLKFTKTQSKKRINYIITHNNKKIKLKVKNCCIPFGTEEYNNKLVVNIEITPDKTNNHHNIYKNIKSLEKKIENIYDDKYCPKNLKKDIYEKDYHKNIKKREHSYLIRTYIIGSVHVHRTIGMMKLELQPSNIKKTICDVELELGILWISADEYGILWFIKDIEILKELV